MSSPTYQSAATGHVDQAYLLHKLKQQEVHIQALDLQVSECNRAREELEAKLAAYDTCSATPSCSNHYGKKAGSWKEAGLKDTNRELREENQRLCHNEAILKIDIEELYVQVSTS